MTILAMFLQHFQFLQLNYQVYRVDKTFEDKNYLRSALELVFMHYNVN